MDRRVERFDPSDPELVEVRFPRCLREIFFRGEGLLEETALGADFDGLLAHVYIVERGTSSSRESSLRSEQSL
jgi:hypothetical protein